MHLSKQEQKITHQLIKIVSEVAYLFLDTLEEENRPDCSQWDCIGIELKFKGYTQGKISVWTTKECAHYIALNMLGSDDDTSVFNEEKALDALKEVVNIMCGNILTIIYGEDHIFELGLPSTVSHDQLNHDASLQYVYWFIVENNPMLICIELIESNTPRIQ